MDYTVSDITIIPIITGLVQVLKYVGLPKKYCPLVALLYGILAGIFYISPNDLSRGVLMGIIAGLSACGLYTQTKALTTKEEKSNDD